MNGHINRISLIIISAYAAVMLLLLPFSMATLGRKHVVMQNYRSVELVLPWRDCELSFQREARPMAELIPALTHSPVTAIAAPLTLSDENETRIRDQGWSIYWLLEQSDAASIQELKRRFFPRDAVFSLSDYAPGFPTASADVVHLIKERGGFFPLTEIQKKRGALTMARSTMPRVAKTHVLPAEEMIIPQKEGWLQRLVRAVRERSVRVLVVQLSPGLSFDQNMQFLLNLRSELANHDYLIKGVKPIELWTMPIPMGLSVSLAWVISFCAPIIGVLIIIRFRYWSPWVLFFAVCGTSLLSGVISYGLGSTPDSVLGIQLSRGVKFQLIVPVLVTVFLLLESFEWQALMNMPLTGRTVFWGGLLGGLVIAMYIMRSGNFPILPVSSVERFFRDILETILGTRPRFKEFLIGHPFMIAGLIRWCRTASKGRLFIMFGILGQISILNTFAHYHTPLDVCVLRTIHGMWIGFLLSWVFIRNRV